MKKVKLKTLVKKGLAGYNPYRCESFIMLGDLIVICGGYDSEKDWIGADKITVNFPDSVGGRTEEEVYVMNNSDCVCPFEASDFSYVGKNIYYNA